MRQQTGIFRLGLMALIVWLMPVTSSAGSPLPQTGAGEKNQPAAQTTREEPPGKAYLVKEAGFRSSWDNLAKLAKGSSVRVAYRRFESIEGRLVAVSDDMLTIKVHHRRSKVETEETLPRSDVLKVSARRLSPIKTVLLGAVGAGLGALVVRYSNCPKSGWTRVGSSSVPCKPTPAPSSTAIKIGAGVGAAGMGLLGALAFPDYKVVYARVAEEALDRVPPSSEPESGPAATQPAAQEPVPATLSPGEDIVIKSTPGGADITVDGRLTGTTPFTLRLALGEHTISIEKPGFKAWKRTMTVSAGGSVNVDATLERTL